MTDPLLSLRRLYADALGDAAEASSGGDVLPEAARREAEALAPVVRALESLPKRRPPSSVVEAAVSAPLASVRVLYGEASSGSVPEAARREAEALAPVVRALESLPKRRPPSSVVEAAVSAPLASVRVLYGEASSGSVPEAARREAEALAPVVRALESLPKRRPPSSVVEAAVAAGRRPVAYRAGRSDRVPARPRRGRRVGGPVVGALFAVLVALAVLLWPVGGPAPEPVAERAAVPSVPEVPAPAPEPVEAAPDPEPPADVPPRVAQAMRPPAASPSAPVPPPPLPPAATALPPLPTLALGFADVSLPVRATSAEFEDEVLRALILRLEALQEAGLAWDEPPEALGAPAPVRSPARGWMQVRVQR